MSAKIGKGCLEVQLLVGEEEIACGVENEETKDASEWIPQTT